MDNEIESNFQKHFFNFKKFEKCKIHIKNKGKICCLDNLANYLKMKYVIKND